MRKSGRRHEIADPQLTEPEMEAVRDEVFRVLGLGSDAALSGANVQQVKGKRQK